MATKRVQLDPDCIQYELNEVDETIINHGEVNAPVDLEDLILPDVSETSCISSPSFNVLDAKHSVGWGCVMAFLSFGDTLGRLCRVHRQLSHYFHTLAHAWDSCCLPISRSSIFPSGFTNMLVPVSTFSSWLPKVSSFMIRGLQYSSLNPIFLSDFSLARIKAIDLQPWVNFIMEETGKEFSPDMMPNLRKVHLSVFSYLLSPCIPRTVESLFPTDQVSGFRTTPDPDYCFDAFTHLKHLRIEGTECTNNFIKYARPLKNQTLETLTLAFDVDVASISFDPLKLFDPNIPLRGLRVLSLNLKTSFHSQTFDYSWKACQKGPLALFKYLGLLQALESCEITEVPIQWLKSIAKFPSGFESSMSFWRTPRRLDTFIFQIRTVKTDTWRKWETKILSLLYQHFFAKCKFLWHLEVLISFTGNASSPALCEMIPQLPLLRTLLVYDDIAPGLRMNPLTSLVVNGSPNVANPAVSTPGIFSKCTYLRRLRLRCNLELLVPHLKDLAALESLAQPSWNNLTIPVFHSFVEGIQTFCPSFKTYCYHTTKYTFSPDFWTTWRLAKQSTSSETPFGLMKFYKEHFPDIKFVM